MPRFFHFRRELPRALRRCMHEPFLVVETRNDGGRVERAHFRARFESLQPFLPENLPIAVGRLRDHVAVHAATRRVVDDDVALRANAGVDVAIGRGIAGRAVVGPARVDRHDARARVEAVVHVARDFVRLRGQVRILLLARHAARWRDGHDDFRFAHGCRLREKLFRRNLFDRRTVLCCSAYNGIYSRLADASTWG